MNTFIIIVGNVRSSKSYFGLKISELYEKVLGNKFDVNKQCSFDILPFLKWSKKEKGSIFILDEVGCTLNPQEWYEMQSKIMRNFVFSQGFRGNVLCLILPNVSNLLKSIRFMGNYVIETIKQGVVKVYRLRMRHSFGKGYLEYIGIINFGLPSQETINDYEQMKKDWNDRHLKDDIDILENLNTPSEKELQKQEYMKLRNEKMKMDIELMKGKKKELDAYGLID